MKPANPSPRTLQDLLLQVVGPILIMGMVCSLVFFLIEVFYRGPHTNRIRWIFGLFTIAAVLVSRISIESGRERAAIFGLLLGFATLLSGTQLVTFDYGALALLAPVVLVGFIATVMWSAGKLTWDCTVIDNSRDTSAIGLTELVFRRWSGTTGDEKVPLQRSRDQQAETATGQTEADYRGNILGSLLRIRPNQDHPNTPGLWVFYFSFAAFPIFGFGQWFVQPAAGSWVFLLFALYLGSGLGLLMLTSLLSLERYLKKRKTVLPDAIAREWLAIGTAVAIAAMLLVLIVPKPNISTRLENTVGWLTTKKKTTSQNAMGTDGRRPDNNATNQRKSDDPNAAKIDRPGGKDPGGQSSGGKTGSSSGQKRGTGKNQGTGQGARSTGSQGQKQPGQADSSNRDNSNNQRSDSQSSKSGTDRDNNPVGDSQANNRQQTGGPPGDPRKARRQQPGSTPGKASSSDEQQVENRETPESRSSNRRQQADSSSAGGPSGRRGSDTSQFQSPSAPALPSWLSGSIKGLTYLVGLGILAVALWMFRDELASFWKSWFGKKKQVPRTEQENRPHPVPALPGFAQFQNPFASGSSASWSPAQILDYSFKALEAWARDREVCRDSDRTPHEFADRIQSISPDVGREARILADLHGQLQYGGQKLSPNETAKLSRLWQAMGG